MKKINGDRLSEIQAIESAKIIAQLQREKVYLIAELEEYKKMEIQEQQDSNTENKTY
ncbi:MULTISPECIES: hypothetical protein [unclassified Virgibacillus]|uniref:hypothetical protein n=1 Tax=unclassified Virgibacillus TaxID=2620237 RepID=UPI0003FCB949|nr:MULTISPECIES: hypothetical protein [Bacillaceae]MDY7046190.1 hypothetical protein [Virgibacillus sp. M23]